MDVKHQITDRLRVMGVIVSTHATVMFVAVKCFNTPYGIEDHTTGSCKSCPLKEVQ